MRCPSCGSAELTAGDEPGLLACASCRGLLLEKGQLDRLAGPHSGDLEFSTLDLDSGTHADGSPQLDCPACDGGAMAKVEFNIHTGIILDHCSSCGSFWLDHGELTRIRQEVEELEAADEAVRDPLFLALAKAFWTFSR